MIPLYRQVKEVENYELNKEIKIGKWINGEDLYSITVQGTSPKVTTDSTFGDTTYIDLTSLNVKEGMLKNAWIIDHVGNIIGMPYLSNSGYMIKSFFNADLKSIEINCNIKNYSEKTVIAELIYTKNN